MNTSEYTQFKINIPDDLLLRLQEIAKETDCSWEEVALNAIKQGFKVLLEEQHKEALREIDLMRLATN